MTDKKEDLTSKNFGPQEGFILSRVDGVWDVESIIDVCPFRPAEILMVLLHLQAEKVIAFNS